MKRGNMVAGKDVKASSTFSFALPFPMMFRRRPTAIPGHIML
jgi:hypothetical protein